MIELERDNVRFTIHQSGTRWVFNAQRISNGHRLPGQKLFTEDPSDFIKDLATAWLTEHGSLRYELSPVHCYACNAVLVSDADTNYQYDNALWVGLFGGYGMFVDVCDFPINTEDRWLRDSNGEYLLHDEALIPDPDWEPEYREERILPGRPDHEAVICHRCAHDLCNQVPWMNKLIDPESSHAHPYNEKEALLAEGQEGWDL